MQRRTAILLLLLAIAGTFVPLAQAATAAPPHACCLRQAHHCHDSALMPTDQLVIRDASCCSHDCCRAVTTAQWAHPPSQLNAVSAQRVEAHVAQSHSTTPVVDLTCSRSPRAPPRISIA
jgi:hypothetical protein